MKILIIEDETSLANNIADYLSVQDYSCEFAEDYEEAIDKVNSYDYDCILLEVDYQSLKRSNI